MACIAGAISEAHYGGVPAPILEAARERLDASLLAVVDEFCARYVEPSRPGDEAETAE